MDVKEVLLPGVGLRHEFTDHPAQEVLMCCRPAHGVVVWEMAPRTPGGQCVQGGVEVFASAFGRVGLRTAPAVA